ncbi:DUF3783 domain-containing protein [Konateibacter massiliensis]|uniref:DUF3783 domain-containing protein n=1 Tax=Konateibacter massiliensis TaxID=2002841 RepID=UPI000C14BD3C|nr:DUF3783 domain-containing protein [Konateibacter massiliensis]
MKPTVLLYNFNDTERNRKITLALMPLGFRLKKVMKENYNQPIGYIAGVKGIESIEEKYEGEELEDEMLIMVGLKSAQIDSLIAAFRKNGIPKVNCKAILTETNQYWNAIELYKELKLEHETMSKKSSQDKVDNNTVE